MKELTSSSSKLCGLPAWSESTLLLLGHGSSTNKDSRVPTDRHAEAIRRAGHFHDVVTAFWMEEPKFGQALSRCGSASVYVVPNFISEGFYTKNIIPRELGMTGRVSRCEGKTLFYCDPVGSHVSMTRALLRQADEVLQGSSLDRSRMGCILVGHGTPQNRKSTEMIKKQVERLRETGRFGEVTDAYMEEAPFIAEWDRLTGLNDVLVVPFFIADGLHSYEDIPELMGLSKEEGKTEYPRPARLRKKNLWYARSIGNQRECVNVILDLVRQFDPHQPFCSSCPPGRVVSEDF